jgi:hypothetical protein
MAEKTDTISTSRYDSKKNGRKFNQDELNFLENAFKMVKTDLDLDILVKSFNKNKQWISVRKVTIKQHFDTWKSLQTCGIYINFLNVLKFISIYTLHIILYWLALERQSKDNY